MEVYLIRHAKSSWNFDLDDFHRPLNERGRKDVLKMGNFLKTHLQAPVHMVSSPASRAFYTALFLADAWSLDENNVVLEPKLYHGTSSDILQVIDTYRKGPVAIFGHNPGFNGFIRQNTGSHLDNLPTCGVAHLTFDEALRSATLTDLYLPKKI